MSTINCDKKNDGAYHGPVCHESVFICIDDAGIFVLL